VITESTIRAKINTLTIAEVVSSQAMEFLHYSAGEPSTASPTVEASFEAAVLSVLSDVQIKARHFGVEVERIEVQHVHLPKDIQDAINETRIAFLAPIRGEREAEAKRITLEKLVSVLGKDTVALDVVMKNFQNANFVTPANFMQPLFDSAKRKVEKMGEQPTPSKQLADN
jgi:exonuclease VII small subunit